ncbi:MAG TPA: condensation domain-containing protein, partial [Chloroflexota bacterium]
PDTRRECPEGRVGELWVASPAVALGYWNRPEATEETFGARLSNTGEGPFLRTGDLGFFHDGQLFVTGRLKETIIIRGRNLYPQDIERTVEGSHPAIRPECGGAFAVQVGEEEQLAVVYEVDGDADSTAVVAAIRGAIAARHEVQPYGVVLLRPGTVPRTTTGKLQRSGCRQAFLERRLEAVQWSVLGENGGWSRREYVAPRMPTEHALALLWEAVLGVERVGINDDFFELGGDSLLSVQLTARARQQGIALTLQHLLEHRTLAELARVTREPSLIVAEQGIVSGPAPLVPAQQLFFAPESRRLSEDWTTPLVIEMPTPGDPIIMERAVRRLVEHHDALRMRIVETESGRHQVNDAAEHHDIFTFIDGAQLSKEEQLTALETAVAQKAHALNPWLGPMVHAIYLNRDIKRGSLVVLLVHHLVLDAPSGEILADDLRTLYDQLQRDEAGTLPSKTTSLRDWTNRLAEYAQSDEARSDLPYWLNQYSPEVAALPTDYPYTSQDIGHLRMIAVSLRANETALLRTSLAGSGLHLSEAATTAVLKAFETWTGCRSLLLSEVGHGRVPVFADLDVSRTVGWFTTLFPVLLDLGDALDVRAELQAVSAKLRSVPNGGLGYGALRYLSRDPETVAKLAALPTPEVRFNYQGEQVLSPTTLRLSAAIFRGPEGNSDVRRARSHVEIWCNIQSGALHLQFIYHEAVYKPSTIKELSSAAIEALRAIIAENRASELAPART